MDAYQGQFSKKLAEWAISKMRVKHYGKEEEVKAIPLDAVIGAMKNAGVNIHEECIYTAYYLWHMAIADNPRSLDSDNRRAWYVDEKLNDPDGKPSNVLACFRAKMDNAGIPIMWERMI